MWNGLREAFINNSALLTMENKIQIYNNKKKTQNLRNFIQFMAHPFFFILFPIRTLCFWFVSLPLNVPIIRLLMMCHSCGSPVFLAMIKCCLHGETSKWVIGPPGTVMQRIWDGSGTGNQPVSGTSCEMFWINFHDLAFLIVRII